MKLSTLLLELYTEYHYMDRFAKRLINNNEMDIVLEYKSNTYVTIGRYKMPNELKEKLRKDFEYLHNKTSNSLSKFNFGIKMHIFDMVDVINNADLNSNITDDVKLKIFDGLAKHKVHAFLKEKETGSMGLALVTAIVNNRMVTTMFVKGTDDDFIERKMKGDSVYFILDSPYDIDKYLDKSSL